MRRGIDCSSCSSAAPSTKRRTSYGPTQTTPNAATAYSRASRPYWTKSGSAEMPGSEKDDSDEPRATLSCSIEMRRGIKLQLFLRCGTFKESEDVLCPVRAIANAATAY